MTIHREMTIDEILSTYPGKAPRLAQVLSGAGLSCVGCQAATWETLEAGVFGHGLGEEDLGKLMKQLNDVLEGVEAPKGTISMTEAAATKYHSILEAEGKQGWGVRFAEKPGGCGGYEYVLDYSERLREDDQLFESHGIPIHVPKVMVENLLGSEIDYVDGLRGSGFKITNPNVRSSCGCGSSHNY
jgi:iron-sulfur cluster assembly accessory protein